MNEIIEKSKCCGCHACYSICPKNAIRMEFDDKGFKYPVIDQAKCVNCGICKKVCPVLKNSENQYSLKAYAMINKNDEERLNSSSGGIFILLAKYILSKKGVVFGAAFDEEFNVKHICIDDEKYLSKLQGSKYVQSDINDTYKDVKYFLNKGSLVLFTGTSCQIEGLKSYLNKNYENLYTQDIICHGVPSPKVWQKYLDYQKKKYNENIKFVSFRNKDYGWSLFQTKILFETKCYSASHHDDIFMKAFLKNSCLRESCYQCHFKRNYRISDITLADFWGINKVDSSMNDEKGTSIVIINSENGQELFDLIKGSCKYKEIKLEQVKQFNPAYVKSAVKDSKYDEFYKNIDNTEFDELIRKYVSKASLIKQLKSKIKRFIKS